MESIKKCCKCKRELATSAFGHLKSSKDGFRYDCNECRKAYREQAKEHIQKKNKEYFEKNKKTLIVKNRKYREDNKDTIALQRLEYRARTKEHIKKKNKEYLPIKKLKIKIRRKEDKGFQLSELLKSRTHKALKSKSITNSSTIQTNMGCNVATLKKWLEFQFNEEMNWDNLGVYWEVDHILPIAQFNLVIERDRLVCFNWTNLQPLYKGENRSKSKKIMPHYYFNSIISVHRFIQNTKSNYDGYQSINMSLCWLREKLRYGKNPNE
jgi:hypothetical protein